MAKKVVHLSAEDRRKPPRPDAKKVAAFVAGGPVEASPREKLHVYVPQEVATAFRVYCATNRRELSEVATEALAAFLATKGQGA